MTIDEWINHWGFRVKAKCRVHDTDGSYVKRGEVGELCDVDTTDGYVIVDFPSTGPVLCSPHEVKPA